MSNNCGKCKVNASNRELLRCFGGCRLAFHPGCIENFKVDQWGKLFKDCPYAKFVCHECQNVSYNQNITEMSKLRDSLAEVIITVNTLSTKVDKRFDEIQNEISAVNQPVQSSSLAEVNVGKTTASNYAQIVGTGEICDTIQTVAVRSKQYLYVSHLHPSTVTDNLKSYVGSKLNLTPTEIDCWPLVPKNRDINSLNFISFKVGLYDEDIAKALAPDFWPSGTSIRRFVPNDRQKNGKFPNIPVSI